MNELTKEEISRLHYGKDHKSISEIARMYKCSKDTVKDMLGISGNKSIPETLEDADILEDLKSLKPIKYKFKNRDDIFIPLPIKVFSKNKAGEARITLVLSDMHLGDTDHLPETFWSTVHNLKLILEVLIKRFQIPHIDIIVNGDLVCGKGVFRFQESRTLTPRTHWQTAVAEIVLREVIEDIESVLPVKDMIILKGTHEEHGSNYAILIKRSIDKAKYGGHHLVYNLGQDIGKCNMLVTHGYGSCLDIESEILTEDGFKTLNEISYEDKVATLDKNGFLEYQYPNNIPVFDYDGQMIMFKGRSIDLRITPNHRLLVNYYPKNKYYTKKNKDGWRFKTAGEVADTFAKQKYIVKQDAKWCGKNEEYFEVPYYSKKGYESRTKHIGVVPIKDWIKFLGFFLAEGCTTVQNKRVSIAQSKNSPFFDEMYNSIVKLGLVPKYDKRRRELTVSSTELSSYLRENIGTYAWNKKIPKEFKQLSKDLIKILLMSYLKGDGTKESDLSLGFKCCNTTSKHLADDLQECFLKIGMDSWIREIPPEKDGYHKNYCVNIRAYNTTPCLYQKPEFNHSKEKVWCVTVSNRTILVRRNGKITWTGNSDYYPLSYTFIRDMWETVTEYSKKGVPIERICVGHYHWLFPNLPIRSLIADCTGGFQRWEKTVSQRDAGMILYFYYDGEVSAIPVRPDQTVQSKEINDSALEYKNMNYYGRKLLKHLETVEHVDVID